MKKFVERSRAADVFQIAFGQDQARQRVHALRAQKILEREVDGVCIAAIDEPVVGAAVGVNVNGVAAVERQHGQIGLVARRLPLPEVNSTNEE